MIDLPSLVDRGPDRAPLWWSRGATPVRLACPRRPRRAAGKTVAIELKMTCLPSREKSGFTLVKASISPAATLASSASRKAAAPLRHVGFAGRFPVWRIGQRGRGRGLRDRRRRGRRLGPGFGGRTTRSEETAARGARVRMAHGMLLRNGGRAYEDRRGRWAFGPRVGSGRFTIRRPSRERGDRPRRCFSNSSPARSYVFQLAEGAVPSPGAATLLDSSSAPPCNHMRRIISANRSSWKGFGNGNASAPASMQAAWTG